MTGGRSAATTFREDEIKLLNFLMNSILRGVRGDELQSLSRRREFKTVCQKLQKMQQKVRRKARAAESD